MSTPQEVGPAIDSDLKDWIGKVTGGCVESAVGLDRWRPTWFVDVSSPQGTRQLVLKAQRAPQHVVDRSSILGRFGVDREAVVLHALQDSGVIVPRFVGADGDRHVLLMERVAGSAILQKCPPGAERDRLMAEYGAALAVLHRVAWRSLPNGARLAADPDPVPYLPGPLGAVVQDWAYVRTQLHQPEPLLELALCWLAANVPPQLEAVLLHGDAGANQFLYDAHGLRAIIDWELSYVGDPMSDLGYARFREALYPTGSYAALVEGYAGGGGWPVNDASITWHTVVACLVMLLGIARDVHRPRAIHHESVQRLWWDALSRLALCQTLGEASGRPAPRAAPVMTNPLDSTIARVASLLAQRLDAGVLSGPSDRGAPVDAALATAVVNLATSPPDDDYCSAADRLGVGAGRRATRSSGSVARSLAAIVEEDGLRRLDDLLDLFTAEASRQVTALAPLAISDRWDDESALPRELTTWAPVLPVLIR